MHQDSGRNAVAKVWDVQDNSRLHVPPPDGRERGSPRKHVPEGGSVLLECDAPGWSFCRWTHQDNVTTCERVAGVFGPCAAVRDVVWVEGSACTLHLSRVEPQLAGQWTALLLIGEEEGNSFYQHCSLDIVTFVPAKVAIKTPPARIPASVPYLVECLAGQEELPRPHMSATARGRKLKEVSPITSESQTVKLFEYLPFVNESGGVELACTAEQHLDGHVVFATKSAATTVIVTPPQPLPTITAELVVNRPGSLNLSVVAFPPPGRDDISWHFVAENSSQSFQVVPADLSEDYNIMVNQQGSSYSAYITLTFRSVQLEDFLYQQYLRVSNEAGARDYAIEISEKRVEQVDGESEGGINTTAYIILTLVLVMTFLMVMVIFSIVNAKMTGTCCFKVQSKPIDGTEEEEGNLPLNTFDKEEKKGRPNRVVLHTRPRTPSPILRRSQKLQQQQQQARGGQAARQPEEQQPQMQQQQARGGQPARQPEEQQPQLEQQQARGGQPVEQQQPQLQQLLHDQEDGEKQGHQQQEQQNQPYKKISVVSRESTYPVM